MDAQQLSKKLQNDKRLEDLISDFHISFDELSITVSEGDLKQVLIISISTTRTNSLMFFLMNWTEKARLSFEGLCGLRFVV